MKKVRVNVGDRTVWKDELELSDLVNCKIVAVSGEDQTDDMEFTVEKDGERYVVNFGSRCGCGVGVDIRKTAP